MEHSQVSAERASVREQKALDVVDAIDAGVPRRVLVSGDLPPHARDLDLVVRETERRALAPLLERHAFSPRSARIVPARRWTEQWVWFGACSAYSIDLNPAERWALPPAELEALFAEATPLEGRLNLARPSPHHVVLMVARRVVSGDGRLSEKRRARLDRALAQDPAAWAVARERAAVWGVSSGLALLEATYERQAPAPRKEQARARVEVLLAAGGAGRRSELLLRRALAKRPRSAKVVSFSGLDGAGKSSQVSALEETLAGLGVEVATTWKPLGHNPALHAVRRTAKKLLRRRVGAGAGSALSATPAPTAVDNPAKTFREKSEVLTHGWVTIVALANALFYRRAALRHGWRGGVVIFDRYVLDSVAQLRHFYGEERNFAFQTWLIQALCPRPVRSYFLDVPPETVMARKDLQYGLEQLHHQAKMYRVEAPRLAVARLDGQRPREELCEEIANEVWRALA